MDEAVPPPERPIPFTSVLAPDKRHHIRGSVRAFCKTTLQLSAIFIVMILLFYGSAWNPNRYYKRIHVGVVDRDGGTASHPPPCV